MVHQRFRVVAAATTAVAIAVAALSLLAPASAQTPDPNRWLTDLRVANMAHGGGLNEAPQGTMYAYATAVDRGADVLEMDLHITRDGHVVTIHDSTVDRTTNGTGCVVSQTLAELKALDAAHTFVPGRGVASGLPASEYPYRGVRTGSVAPPEGFTADDFAISTLEELFQELPDSWMLMELKPTEVYQTHDCPGFVESLPEEDRPDLAAEVARLIDEYDMTDKVMVASFIDDLMHRFVSLAPEVDTSFPVGESVGLYGAFLAEEPPANPHGHVAIQVPRSFGPIVVTQELVAWARSHGIAVHFWTINDEAEMRELLDWGIDGLITDEVQLLDRLLQERGEPRPDQPTPPPASTTTTTTTAPEASTTTTADGATTTTAALGPSTTVPGGADAQSTVSDPAEASDPIGAPSRESGTGAAAGQQRSAGALPGTGSDPDPLVLSGAVLVAAGAGALLIRRRLSRGEVA